MIFPWCLPQTAKYDKHVVSLANPKASGLKPGPGLTTGLIGQPHSPCSFKMRKETTPTRTTTRSDDDLDMREIEQERGADDGPGRFIFFAFLSIRVAGSDMRDHANDCSTAYQQV